QARVGLPRPRLAQLQHDAGVEQVHHSMLSRWSQAPSDRSPASSSTGSGMARISRMVSLSPEERREAAMLISPCVGWPRSVISTGSMRAARLAWLTSRLNSRLVRSFTGPPVRTYVPSSYQFAGRYLGASRSIPLDNARRAGTVSRRGVKALAYPDRPHRDE